MSSMTELYVRDRRTGKAHRVGDDQHDRLHVEESGIVQYYNLQNGDGTLCGDEHEADAGYEFVQADDLGNYDDETLRQAQEFREAREEWEKHRAELAAQGITVIS